MPRKTKKAKPDPLASLRGLVPPEQLKQGHIAANARGGGTVLDWADKLRARGHLDAQELSAFRHFEALKEAVSSGGGGIDPGMPKVSGGKADAFSHRKLEAGMKLRRIHQCIGAFNYDVLCSMIGTKNASDFHFDRIDHRKKPEIAHQAVVSLLSHFETIKVLS